MRDRLAACAGADVKSTNRARCGKKEPNSGEEYMDAEVELIFRVVKSKANAAAIGLLLGRTPSAIEWVWRTLDEGGEIGTRASERLFRQCERVRQVLGRSQRGTWGRL